MSVQSDSREYAATATEHASASPRRPMLSVVVPVYNGGEEIVENVTTIRRAAAGDLPPDDIELIVVSDGSIDGTTERLIEARSDVDMHVIHYDHNAGKGYAVKLGALAAAGSWIAVVDADLDLDPGAIPSYLATAQRDRLDFAIGSKRHPDSAVFYPRSRRVASWCYQQLNRVLFRLDVRDTQVGLKVFSREVADNVVPLLLVKQFAFDLELLAVAHSLGYGRIRELPVRLDYRFSGSGVRSRAVVRALWDTAAVYYRLRILHTYRRKQGLVLAEAQREELPVVTLLGDPEVAEALDYPRLHTVRSLVDDKDGDLVAVPAPGARPAGNWLLATLPYFARADIAAVVVPTLAPPTASLRERGAAAVLESRLGGGSRRFRYLPGNVRIVSDHPAESLVIRRADYLAAREAGADDEGLVAWLAERGRLTVYTPDTWTSAAPPPLLGPHLRGTIQHARARGASARRSRGASLSAATTLSLLPLAGATVGAALLAGSERMRTLGAVLVVAYGGALFASGLSAAIRFRSLAVFVLEPPMVVVSQVAYAVGFFRGLLERHRQS